MSFNSNKRGRGGGKRFHRRYSSDEVQMDDRAMVSDDSPVAHMFHQFQVEMDGRHDKYERLIKVSRDITIESKRIIFLLHRIDSIEMKERIAGEVHQKLEELRNRSWHQVALELHNEDPYQFLRAYSSGLQEYIEAMSFLYYIEQHALLSLQQVESNLTFSENPMKDKHLCALENASISGTVSDVKGTQIGTLSVYVPPVEYMLGLADLTGELMRMAIGCIGRGEFHIPNQLCNFIQSMHSAFLAFGNQSRELSSKFTVLRQSMRKVEDACYALHVRGSELPKHLLADVLSSTDVVGMTFYETSNDISHDYVE